MGLGCRVGAGELLSGKEYQGLLWCWRLWEPNLRMLAPLFSGSRKDELGGTAYFIIDRRAIFPSMELTSHLSTAH